VWSYLRCKGEEKRATRHISAREERDPLNRMKRERGAGSDGKIDVVDSGGAAASAIEDTPFHENNKRRVGILCGRGTTVE